MRGMLSDPLLAILFGVLIVVGIFSVVIGARIFRQPRLTRDADATGHNHHSVIRNPILLTYFFGVILLICIVAFYTLVYEVS